MTIAYSEGIQLLKQWKGSVWRAVWKELLFWLVLYYTIRSLLLYYPWTNGQYVQAVKVVQLFEKFLKDIPVSWLLGFYVGQQIVTRWWTQVNKIPWPDEIMLSTNASFPNPHQKYIRQSVARWIILCQAMVFRRISTRVRRRFPKMDSLIHAGLMTAQERELIRRTKCVNNRWQLPLHWIVTQIVAPSDLAPPSRSSYIANLNKFGEAMRTLHVHDWIEIPLVYAQMCTVIVYGYFLFCAIGHQYIGQNVDLYVPWLTILQFLFYVGWLRVGQDLMRPFGEDDDDVELNCILDRNAAVAMNLADQVAAEAPTLIDDPEKQKVFVELMLNNMAYSKSSMSRELDQHPHMHAVVRMKPEDMEMVPGEECSHSHEHDVTLAEEGRPLTGKRDKRKKKTNRF